MQSLHQIITLWILYWFACRWYRISFIKVVKYCLNLDIFSDTTLCWCRYLHSHVWLNIYNTIAYYLSMYYVLSLGTSSSLKHGDSTILKHPLAGSSIIMKISLTFLWVIASPAWCCHIDLECGPIRSICTDSHGFNSKIILGGICVLTDLQGQIVWPDY